MMCRSCRGGTHVADTRLIDNVVTRRRVCKECGLTILTKEVIFNYYMGRKNAKSPKPIVVKAKEIKTPKPIKPKKEMRRPSVFDDYGIDVSETYNEDLSDLGLDIPGSY